ncbi:MAG: penicillin-binding protein activator, partial [Gammaproteobacteria bacterium]
QYALQLLAKSPAGSLDTPMALTVHRLRLDAFARMGRHLEATGERVEMELLLTEEHEIQENRRKIWDTLARLTPRALGAFKIAPPDTLGGWVALATATKQYLTHPDLFEKEIARWKAQFPGHPAGPLILPELLASSRVEARPPTNIALLLPLKGPFAGASAAIRDGFLAAWYGDQDNPQRPDIRVLDSSGSDIRGLYDQALTSGTDLVVGPLRKEQVESLAETGAFPVNTLALNSPGSKAENTAPTKASPERLYLFTLSPEEEARQVAERAWFDGHVYAAVIAPSGDWGARVSRTFSETWQALGGIVVEQQTFDKAGKDRARAVRDLLNVDESEQRRRALARTLGSPLKYEARRRQDVDFVFMAAFPSQARQLTPQFRFYSALPIPVYATSHVYTGTEDRGADRDIDGVIFPDMPWTVQPKENLASLRTEIAAAWPQSFERFVRLFAFGVDAYHLVPQLGRLKAQPFAEFSGVTGRLSVVGDNQVRRQLSWVRFRGGRPRAYGEGGKRQP